MLEVEKIRKNKYLRETKSEREREISKVRERTINTNRKLEIYKEGKKKLKERKK